MGATREFRVGDRVRVVNAISGGKVGDIGVVTGLGEYVPYFGQYYRIDGLSGGVKGLYELRLEPAPLFAVGDRVRVKYHPYYLHGGTDVGTIVAESAPHCRGKWHIKIDDYLGGSLSFLETEMELIPLRIEAGRYYIISEWTEEEPKRYSSCAAAEVDNLRDEYGPFTTPSTPSNPAIVARHTSHGSPRPSAQPFVHPNREAATTEAQRLARNNPGYEFGVYELAGTAKEAKVYEHEWQRLATEGQKFTAISRLRKLTGLNGMAAGLAVDNWLERESA